MEIEWRYNKVDGDVELWINGVDMGWVDGLNNVHCMWMTYRDVEDDAREHLIASQYPEDHGFETQEEAKAALLEAAVPVYIGGFRGR